MTELRIDREALERAIEDRSDEYREHVEKALGDPRIAATLRVLGRVSEEPAELYILPCRALGTIGGIRETMQADEKDHLGYISAWLGPVGHPDLEMIGTPEHQVEPVCLSHELEHLILAHEGLRTTKPPEGSPEECVLHFGLWVEETAVSLRSIDRGFDPTGIDLRRSAEAIHQIGEKGETLRNAYTFVWGETLAGTAIEIRISPARLGIAAGMAYFTAGRFGESAAAEFAYRARRLQQEAGGDPGTRLPEVLCAVASWALQRGAKNPKDINRVIETFRGCVLRDLEGASLMGMGLGGAPQATQDHQINKEP